MSKILLTIGALAVAAFIGLFVTIPVPLSWVRDAAIAVLSVLVGVQWTIYTAASNPEKLAKFVAKYLPEAEVRALVEDGRDAFSSAVAAAKDRLASLRG